MILDLPRFVAAERPWWEELDKLLKAIEDSPERRLAMVEIERLHYLYERSSSDLSQLDTFSTEPHVRAFLSSLVSRAYSEIHETRSPVKVRLKAAILEFPRAFRRQFRAFQLSLAVTLAGLFFGWFAIQHDPSSKSALMPFAGLMNSPAERVKREESTRVDQLQGIKATFAGQLMTHNIQVTVLTMALGMTWGFGTLVLLFYNGVMLGAVMADYVMAGQSVFLAGWLLPHGSIEIPSILLGGQAGFVLASALIGWGDPTPRMARMRAVSHDLFAIIGGATCLLVWAGVMEAFVSQYHQPVIPYALKIGFGCCELIALAAFLAWAGKE
jgi:uncharacterized membrane protein SpoIIM required for sporulation